MAQYQLEPGRMHQVVFQAGTSRQIPLQHYVIANLDAARTVLIGPASNDRQQPDLTSPLQSSQLCPLQAIHIVNNRDWFARLDPSETSPVTVDVIPDSWYWAPSPVLVAQAVAAALGSPAAAGTA